MSKIKIFSLGGLNENGKNMYVVTVDKDIFIFDAGLKYANEKMLGVDYIIPDYDFIKKNKKDIKGIFITHGHDENMGAVIDIIKEVKDIDIYSCKFTCDIIRRNLEDEGMTFNKLHEILPHKSISFGKNSVFPVLLTHSIPDNVGYVLNTEDGAIVYTGNYIFDSSLDGSYKTDIGKLAYIGKQGVLCLLNESEYADRPGFSVPRNRISSKVRDILMHNEGRIIVTVFTAHISRIQELLTEIESTQRRVVIMGKKLQQMINYVIDNGYVIFNKDRIGTLNNISDKDAVILISNENEKPFTNLERIVNGYDKYIKILPTDTVFYLDPVSVNNERIAVKLSDDIAKLGSKVESLSSKDYLLNHASEEDLKLMINLLNPKYYFPVSGEYRHMVNNADIANNMGIDKENIILKQNGEVAIFENGVLSNETERISINELLIDGNSTKDIGELVLKDREMLSENGIVIVCATLDKKTRKVLAGPEILTRGFIYVKDNIEFINQIKDMSSEIINKNISNNYVDYNKIKTDLRDVLGNFFYNETECKPMVITVINEI
ncbi:MAG: ribonuclease J [Bacilli bacterium]|nr:ribonuclease J [Bacilli bacterium]